MILSLGHRLQEVKGSNDSTEVADRVGALVVPPAIDFTDPMDAASNKGNTLKYNSNSYRGGKIISSGT